MTTDQERLLWEKLKVAFLAMETLRAWLVLHLPSALPYLGSGMLETELTNLMVASKAVDDMQALLQAVSDYPPDPALPPMIFAFTLGEIKPRSVQQGQVPTYQRSFVAGRPFVNRIKLRKELDDLATSMGGQRILVIDGEDRCGKSFAMSMAIEINVPGRIQWPVDIDDYARFSISLNARDFAVAIVGHETGCPAFDITKENEAVPRLMTWLTTELQNKQVWIIIDHCNRKAMTHAASRLLRNLAERLYQGGLSGVRLILADFNRAELPLPMQSTIRHDRAELPTPVHVEEWCRQVATLENRAIGSAEPGIWADFVFEDLHTSYSRSDGSWHLEFEKRLRAVAADIRAHPEQK